MENTPFLPNGNGNDVNWLIFDMWNTHREKKMKHRPKCAPAMWLEWVYGKANSVKEKMLLAIRWQKLENNISRNFVLGFIHMYHMTCIHGNQTETLQIITCKIVLRKISFGAYFSLEFVHSMRFTFTDQTDYIGRISYRNNFRCKL